MNISTNDQSDISPEQLARTYTSYIVACVNPVSVMLVALVCTVWYVVNPHTGNLSRRCSLSEETRLALAWEQHKRKK